MSTFEPIIIARSITKLLLLAAVVLVVMVWSIYMVGFNSNMYLKVVGAVGVFFGAIGVAVVGAQVFSKKPGMVIDADGFEYHGDIFGMGKISWREVTGVNVLTVNSSKVIIVLVANPHQYIERQPKTILKKVMQSNLDQFGSPISISAATLKIGHDELLAIMVPLIKKAQG